MTTVDPVMSDISACRYCGIHSAASVVKCVKTGKWFCNGRVTGTASCIVTHLVWVHLHFVINILGKCPVLNLCSEDAHALSQDMLLLCIRLLAEICKHPWHAKRLHDMPIYANFIYKCFLSSDV